MSEIDPRLVAAVCEQLSRRPVDAARVGWKVGAGDAERIGGSIAVGQLTSATVLAPGSTYRGRGGDLRADAELAIQLGEEETVAGYGAALELVDLAGDDDPETVVAHNVFHRAVAFGPMHASLPREIVGALLVNGERRAAAPVAVDVAETVAAVERIVGSVGERLEPGDRIITGSVVQIPLAAGDEVVAELGALGRVELTIA